MTLPFASTDGSGHRLRPEWVALGFYGLGALFFLYQTSTWWGILIDDAYITYRYAENVADGWGIVWNRGENPVEGCTSPLFLALSAAIVAAGGDVVLTPKVLGLFVHLGLLPFLFWVVVRRFDWDCRVARAWAGFLPGLWLFFSPNVVHAYSGMETSLALLLNGLFAVAVTSTRNRESNKRRIGLLLGLSLALVATRPEAGLIVIAGVVVLALRRETRRLAAVLIVLFGAGVTIYLVWERWYFGYFLPNPFHVKVGSSMTTSLPGLPMALRFLARNAGFLALFLAAAFSSPPTRGKKLQSLELFGLLSIVASVGFLLRVYPAMGFCYRFFWTTMPIWICLSVWAFWRLSGTRTVRFAGGFLLLQLALWGLYEPGPGFVRKLSPRFPADNPFAHYEVNRRIGLAIGALALPYETTLDADEAGLIPYYSRTRSIDFVGLNDNVLTHGTEEEISAYLRANPLDITYSESSSGALDDFPSAEFKAFTELDSPIAQAEGNPARWPRLLFGEYAQDYYYAGTFRWPTRIPGREFLNLWVRRDCPGSERIGRALREAADFYAPGDLRYGPYPEALLNSISLPQD